MPPTVAGRRRGGDQVNESERLSAIEDIRRLKAQYWRGVDTSDGDLVRAILAEDCELDYRGCCTDPASGVDHMPTMNVVLRGRASWVADAFRNAGIVSVHQGHHHEINVQDPARASGIWAFTDRFFMPEGAPFARLTGHGFYHDTYARAGGAWLLQTTRIVRLQVGVS